MIVGRQVRWGDDEQGEVQPGEGDPRDGQADEGDEQGKDPTQKLTTGLDKHARVVLVPCKK